jgi:hypothetical protein
MATNEQKGVELASNSLEPTLSGSNHEKNTRRKPGEGWKEKEVHELPYKCVFYLYTEAFKVLTYPKQYVPGFPWVCLSLRGQENRI